MVLKIKRAMLEEMHLALPPPPAVSLQLPASREMGILAQLMQGTVFCQQDK